MPRWEILNVTHNTKKSIENYCHQSTHISLVDVKNIIETFLKMRDADNFLSSYYSNIALNAEVYFQINKPACTLHAKTLGDKLFCQKCIYFLYFGCLVIGCL